MDDDPECEKYSGIFCAKCYKESDIDFNKRAPNERCRRCSFKKSYYPLEKYSVDQSYVSCSLSTSPPNHYFYDEIDKIHRLCYRTCEKCSTVGNYLEHSCLSCDSNYFKTVEYKTNCYPICQYNYYFNLADQFKCTDDKQQDACQIPVSSVI